MISFSICKYVNVAIYIENPNVSTNKFSKFRKHDAYKITL